MHLWEILLWKISKVASKNQSRVIEIFDFSTLTQYSNFATIFNRRTVPARRWILILRGYSYREQGISISWAVSPELYHLCYVAPIKSRVYLSIGNVYDIYMLRIPRRSSPTFIWYNPPVYEMANIKTLKFRFVSHKIKKWWWFQSYISLYLVLHDCKFSAANMAKLAVPL